jgi:hypothetical protein
MLVLLLYFIAKRLADSPFYAADASLGDQTARL